jgi:hypothetical protein
MNSRGKVTMRAAVAEQRIDVGTDTDGAGAKADAYRRKAQVHAREAALSQNPEMRELQLRLVQSYLALAENEEWLEGQTARAAAGRA